MNDMAAADAISLYRHIRDAGIQIWIDGGWAVDALLGAQTRTHEALDIVLEQSDVPRLRDLLAPLGFHDVERDDTSAWTFVLSDILDRLIDVHAVVFDQAGNGLYGPIERGVMYPAGSLNGFGTIDGRSIACIEAAHLVNFHTGYELRPQDFHDVGLLCQRFGLALPADYQDRVQDGAG